MLNNAELMNLIRDTSQLDDWRRQALETAIGAICEIATLRSQVISLSSLTLTVGGTAVSNC